MRGDNECETKDPAPEIRENRVRERKRPTSDREPATNKSERNLHHTPPTTTTTIPPATNKSE